jgi:hypothetical protein
VSRQKNRKFSEEKASTILKDKFNITDILQIPSIYGDLF